MESRWISLLFLLVVEFEVSSKRMLECYCDHHCPPDTVNGTCHTPYKCFASLEFKEGTKQKILKFGCSPEEYEGGIWQCRQSQMLHHTPYIHKCCHSYSLCNVDLELEIPREQETNYLQKLEDKEKVKSKSSEKMILLVSITVGLLIILLACVYVYHRCKKIQIRASMTDQGEMLIEHVNLDYSSSTVRKLNQRSVAQELKTLEEIGRGNYSVVYTGLWKDQQVAVKVFQECDKASWTREIHFYQTSYLSHENILGFIAADVKDGLRIERLLVTQYHPFGSLRNFLQKHSFDFSILFRLIYSALCGLHYLHKKIDGSHGKPAIAHRNISSKSLLVKDNLQCCIADLGLAVDLNPETNEVGFGEASTHLADIRYMAPEVLADPFTQWREILRYQTADIYSFSLVMWEVLLRCELDGIADEHQLPFEECIGRNSPSIEQMLELVNARRIAPRIPPRFNDDPHARTLIKEMSECFQTEPASRPTTIRLQFNLKKYIEERQIPSEESFTNASVNTCSTNVS